MAIKTVDEISSELVSPALADKMLISDASEAGRLTKIKKITVQNFLKSLLLESYKIPILTAHPALPTDGSDFQLLYGYSPGANQDTQIYSLLRKADGTFQSEEIVRIA